MSVSSERISTLDFKKGGSTGMYTLCHVGSLSLQHFQRRGKSGGQVRDEYREEFDPGRGGYGRAIDMERQKEEEEYGKGR